MNRRALVGVGLATAATAMLPFEPARAWGAYLANVVFWTGLASGALAFSAVLALCNACWASGLRPAVDAWLRPLQLSPLLLLLLPLGARSLYPWASAPVPGLESWLAPLPLFSRDAASLALLALVATAFVRATRRRGAWAVALVVTHVLVWTLLAADLLLSLQPERLSTLFGLYVAVGGMYAGVASIALLARRWHLADGRDVTHDLGKILFGLSLAWAYLIWSQYLVIWYGNLPGEADIWLARTSGGWRPVAALVAAGGVAVPFVALVAREPKRRPRRVAGVGAAVLIALWAERQLLVLPAVAAAPSWRLGFTELGVGVGFALVAVGLLARDAAAPEG